MSSSWNNQSIHHEPEDDAATFTAGSMVTMAILILTFLLGLPGNALVIWVTGLKMKWTVNTVWFLNLAIADFLCCLSLPFSIAQVALHGNWYYGGFLCKVIPSAIIFNMSASVFILVAISMDRCLLVIKPVWAQNHRKVGLALGLCLGIWLLAFLMCVPVFLYRETFPVSNGRTNCGYNFAPDYDYPYSYYDNHAPLDYPAMTTELPNETSKDMTGHKTLDDLITTTAFPNDMAWATSGLNMLGETTMTTGLPTAIPHGAFPTSGSSASALEDSPDRTSLGTVPNIHSSNNEDTSSSHPLRTSKPFLNFDSTIPPGDMSPNELTQLYSGQPDTDSSKEYPEMYESYSALFTPTPLTVTTITRLIFGFVIPLIMILVCYAFILRRVRGAHFSKSSSKTLRVVFSIVSAFFICWAPYHVMGVIMLYTNSPTLRELDHLSQGLAFANSCINPVLYVFTGQDFKDKVRKSLHTIFESAFSEELTRSTAPTRSRNSTDGLLNITAV